MWLNLTLSQSVLMAASKLQHSPARLNTGTVLHRAEPGSFQPLTSLHFSPCMAFYQSDLKASKQGPCVQSVKEPQMGSQSQFGRETQV